MWRRVTSLSSLLSSSSTSTSSLLNYQEAYGLRIWKSLTTESEKVVKREISSRKTCPFIAFVIGGPGSGKGTQCTRIVENFGFTHLSAGDLLRKEIISNKENGAMIIEAIKEGNICLSELTVKLILKAIESSESDKFLIDGFPRSEDNRATYERIVGAEPNIVLFFDCPEEEMMKRVLNRNEGRIDDNEYTARERLKVFRAFSLPLVNYYSKKGKLHKIIATGTEDQIFKQVRPIFDELNYVYHFEKT